MSRTCVAVLGSSKPSAGESLYNLAYRIGHQLGEAGFDLINGGYDGTMTASAAGARAAGARVTGVVCAEIQESRGVQPNEYLTEIIDVPVLVRRLEILMRLAGGYVILPGGTGTLAELALVWEHVNKSFIAPRPIVCVGSFWKPTVAAIIAEQPDARVAIEFARTAEQVAAIMRERAIDVDLDERWLLDAAGAEVRSLHE